MHYSQQEEREREFSASLQQKVFSAGWQQKVISVLVGNKGDFSTGRQQKVILRLLSEVQGGFIMVRLAVLLLATVLVVTDANTVHTIEKREFAVETNVLAIVAWLHDCPQRGKT